MPAPTVSFSHVQLYVDHVDDLSAYKELEDQLNHLSKLSKSSPSPASSARKIDGQNNRSCAADKSVLWRSVVGLDGLEAEAEDKPFLSQQRDVVKQLLVGFGFRVTGARYPGTFDGSTLQPIQTNTRTVLVTSKDPAGFQCVVTAIANPASNKSTAAVATDRLHHFDAARVSRFYDAHHQRQGIAVLAFWVDDVNTIRERYEVHHPKLVSHFQTCRNGTTTVKILEVFAYYQRRKQETDEERVEDEGTILRFMETSHPHHHLSGLPGLVPQPATFEPDSAPAYCDHWVSNVISRTEFLDILNDTLDFAPKVDFNAGVVAAGEAQIESTVTGNDASALENGSDDPNELLRDQRQVYLPINNALSNVGHVHMFLEEIGQGVQHVASRVQDLVSFVQRANNQREAVGEGFTFLNIPRSYYGVLTLDDLRRSQSKECASRIWKVLDQHELLAQDGAVDLSLTRDELDTILSMHLVDESTVDEYARNREDVLKTILGSRYKNLHSLLRDHISEEKYLGIVRNQILVDIQGEDLLYQIFTCKILHRQAKDEAPFFEFIERVCSECKDENGCPQKVRPGCGGFGIRNFLTLFLSIEVSKAMQAVASARAAGDTDKEAYEQTRVDYFTAQLNESNPILTEISDAMTNEGRLQQLLSGAKTHKERELLGTQLRDAVENKRRGNGKLMITSAKYNSLMKTLRKSQLH